MYVDDFDFTKIFNDEYKNVKIEEDGKVVSSGTDAVGIITRNQCVIRTNDARYDKEKNKMIPGSWHHYINENEI